MDSSLIYNTHRHYKGQSWRISFCWLTLAEVHGLAVQDRKLFLWPCLLVQNYTYSYFSMVLWDVDSWNTPAVSCLCTCSEYWKGMGWGDCFTGVVSLVSMTCLVIFVLPSWHLNNAAWSLMVYVVVLCVYVCYHFNCYSMYLITG